VHVGQLSVNTPSKLLRMCVVAGCLCTRLHPSGMPFPCLCMLDVCRVLGCSLDCCLTVHLALHPQRTTLPCCIGVC